MDLIRINRVWQVTGGVLAMVIAITTIFLYGEDRLSLLALIFWLHTSSLMLHEFEEYVFPGGFKSFFNNKTIFAVEPSQDDVPLSESMILWINLSAWFLFLLGALLVDAAPWLGVMMLIFNIVNVFGHLILFQVKQLGYNPGLVTAALILTPLISYGLWYTPSQDLLSTVEWMIAIIGGAITAAALPIFGNMNRRKFMNNQA